MKAFYTYLFAITASCVFAQKTPFDATPQRAVLSARTFGVIPNDGINDYIGMKILAAAAKSTQASEIVFEKGEYIIDTFEISGGPNANSVSSVLWDSLNSCKISGNGAVFKLKGNTHLTQDYFSGAYWFTWTRQVCPFFFQRCKKIQLEGIEVNGQNYLTTRAEILETPAYGLIVHNGCKDVDINSCIFRNMWTDGAVTWSSISTLRPEYVSFTHCKFNSNSRNGLSIVSGVNITAQSCIFEKNGLTNGAFPRFAPASGVDVEDEVYDPLSFLVFKFSKCTFSKNGGSEFIASSGEGLIINECFFEDTITVTAPLVSSGLLVVSEGAIISNNTFYNCDIAIHENAWTTINPVIVSGNRIKALRWGIFHDNISNPIIFTGNTVESPSSLPPAWGFTFFPFANNCRNFSNNEILIDTLLSGGSGRLNLNASSSGNSIKWKQNPIGAKSYYFETVGSDMVGSDFHESIPPVGLVWPLSSVLENGKYIIRQSPKLSTGTTAQRPVLALSQSGYSYFDTTLNKPIFWTGAVWVDSTGTTM